MEYYHAEQSIVAEKDKYQMASFIYGVQGNKTREKTIRNIGNPLNFNFNIKYQREEH